MFESLEEIEKSVTCSRLLEKVILSDPSNVLKLFTDFKNGLQAVTDVKPEWIKAFDSIDTNLTRIIDGEIPDEMIDGDIPVLTEEPPEAAVPTEATLPPPEVPEVTEIPFETTSKETKSKRSRLFNLFK